MVLIRLDRYVVCNNVKEISNNNIITYNEQYTFFLCRDPLYVLVAWFRQVMYR